MAAPRHDGTPATLAEANRSASRLLYRASRDAGWIKLTVRERAKLRLDGAQWQTEAVVAERRAALAGMRADGVGEATHAAAATGAWEARSSTPLDDEA